MGKAIEISRDEHSSPLKRGSSIGLQFAEGPDCAARLADSSLSCKEQDIRAFT
jgi:hypothetical protein